MSTETQIVEEALRKSFIAEALALQTGLTRHEVRTAIMDLTTNACIGELVFAIVQESNPPTTAELFKEVERRYEASRPGKPRLHLVK